MVAAVVVEVLERLVVINPVELLALVALGYRRASLALA
jgi:hypothetical protein